MTQLLRPFYERALHRRQQISLQLEPNLPPLAVDEQSLNRIVAELLNNACKYTPPGGRIDVQARWTVDQDLIEMCVCNTGPEIPPEELLHVFEKFYRVPRSDTWHQGGTGLGLALIKKLVEQMNGKIFASSNSERTSFTIHLPHTLNTREENYL